MPSVASGQHELLKEEEAWWRDNPTPGSTREGNVLTLYNYPVGGTALAEEHKAALLDFVRFEPLDLELTVRGHASPTGERAPNAEFSLRRAQGVRAYLLSLGAKKITLGAAGADESLDGDRSGPGLALNRRVVVRKFPPAPKPHDVGPFLDEEPPPAPTPTDPSSPIKGISAEGSLVDLGPLHLPMTRVLVSVTAKVTLRPITMDPDRGKFVVGAEFKGGKIAAKGEVKILEGLAGKFTIEPPKGTSALPTVQAGVQFKEVIGKPQIGFQKPLPRDPPMPSTQFVYVKFSIEDAIVQRDASDPNSKVDVKGEVTFHIGPGPEMVQHLAQLEAALGGTTAAEGFTAAELSAAGIGGSGGIIGATAAIGGAVAIVAVINGGVIYVVQAAKDEADAWTLRLARRDGKAARVAWAILGAGYEQSFQYREHQWASGAQSAAALDAFREGRMEVEKFLRVEETRDAKVAEWKAKYAYDGTGDFTIVRERVYKDLGGIEKGPDAPL